MAVKESELIVINNKVYHLNIRPDQLGPNIILVGDPGRADTVAAHFDQIDHRVEHREFRTRTGTYLGMPVSVIATGIGTDNTEIALVEAYGLNEFDLETRTRKAGANPLTLIRVGTCGTPQPDIDIGTLAITSYALGLDNTGLFYDHGVPDRFCRRLERAAFELLTDATPSDRRFRGWIRPYASKATEEVLDALDNNVRGPYAIGITVSNSGFFANQGRELPGLRLTIPSLQEHLAMLELDTNRVVNLEMESSLLCHLASHLGYSAGSVCLIIANRPNGTFIKGPDMEPAMDRCITTALDALYELHQKK